MAPSCTVTGGDCCLSGGYGPSRLEYVPSRWIPKSVMTLLSSLGSKKTETHELSYSSLPTSNLYVGMNVIRASE